MNINTITLTGADNKVNKETLIEISNKYRNKYKYVEFGILFSLERQGHNRFPSLSWIKSLPFELRLSGHLCGTYAKQALNNASIDIDPITLSKFQRIQLNHNFKNNPIEYSKVGNLLKSYRIFNFIFQYNNSNKKYLESLIEYFKNENIINYDILFDASGGRGTQIKEITPPPFDNVYTGYSGGITPDNIESICNNILSIEKDINVFIDMESGIRTLDEWDCEKVNRILETYEKVINKEQ